MVELTVFIAFCQPGDQEQHGARDRVAGLLRRVRDSAGRASGAVRRRVSRRMTEDPFVAHRSLLFTVAYEMLGSAADAEDVLQEAWLRWADVDHSQVRDPRAYLIRVVTRQALNQHANAVAPPRGVRRRVAAGTAADQPRRRRGRRARRERLDRDADRAGNARADRAGGVRAARGLRDAVRRDRRGHREVRGRGAADRAAGTRACGGSAAAGAGEPIRAAGRGGAVPGRVANRAVAGTDGGHGARRGPDRRWWRARARRSGSDPRRRARREVARAREPGGGRRSDDDRVAQRRACGPDRDRRPAGAR